MRDPYSVLGVAKTASEKEIKSAYRSLAKRYHPDSAKNTPGAKEKFAEIGVAYDILGDKEKRGQFDRGEIDAEGKPKFQGFEGFNPGAGGHPFEGFEFRTTRGGSPFGNGGGGFGAEDILSEMFGGTFARGSANRGGFARGAGGFQAGAGASGFAQGGANPLDLRLSADVTVEDLARGKATVKLANGKQVSFALPAGAANGQTVRLAGQGNKAPGMQPGDALVTLNFVKHPRFTTEGADITTEADLPLKTAVTGGKVAVETLDGKVALTVPEWTDSGKVFRLKGKGLPKKGGGHGDMLVTLVIRLPKEDRSALEALMRQQGQAKA
ncbi:MAG: DnaJ domain-containing protein [Nitratireductor sp.]|jgi:DnaJ-class molecular chaperone|nr:DnaJ domain-containing protein [Nitratireductor sp.]